MRVLVPRGGDWGDAVARLIADAGHTPVALPLIATEFAESEELRAALAQLGHRFDWLVVTSQNTVPVLPPVPEAVRVAAVGDATAAALAARGIRVSFVPTQQSAAGLVAEWPAREGAVLWPRAEAARPELADGLRAHGMQVTDVVAYRTVPVFASAEALRAAVGNIDAALVTSGSVAREVARLGQRIRVVAIGEQTAADCRKAGLEPSAVAEAPTPESLVRALIDVGDSGGLQ